MARTMKSKSGTREAREKAIPQIKLETVKDLSEKMKSQKTVLIASTNKLPSSQFHLIKKNLRGMAEIRVAKKSLVIKAIENTKKESLQGMIEHVGADCAIFFSQLDPFELSALLTENQSPAKAKAGELAPEDISIEPGPTDLVPGPAISELSGVGLKVAVEGGKLAIKTGAVVAKKGEPIKENVAGVLAKLNIFPMKVGFEPLVAYDGSANKIYSGIKIDKKKAYEELKDSISKALGFAVNVKYPARQTIPMFIAKASAEEKAIQKLVDSKNANAEVAQ